MYISHPKESGCAMRENLRKCRIEKKMTQREVAKRLNVTERYYKSLEYGERVGSVEQWDRLEDLFNVHQRILRKNFDKEDNLMKH